MPLTLQKGFWAGSAGGATDPYFASVVLLLGSAGSGGTFSDLSDAGTTISKLDSPVWSSSEAKFGTQSILFDGSNDALSFPDSTTDLDEDFTFECWFNPDSWSSAKGQNIYTKTVTYTGLGVNGNDAVGATDLLYGHGGTGSAWSLIPAGTSGTAPPDDQWQWVAITYDASETEVTLFWGQSGTATEVGSESVDVADPSTTNYLACSRGTSRFFGGYMQEIRVTQGVCRYKSGDTVAVPTTIFPRS